jgi:hypothetical protein
MGKEGKRACYAEMRHYVMYVSGAFKLPTWNVLGMTFLIALAGASAGAATPDGAPGWTRKTVRFSLTARNLREIKTNVERLIVYAPASTSNQRVLSIEATQEFVQSDDALGNRLLVFTFSELAPFATKRITVSATLEVATQARAAETPVGTPFVGDEPTAVRLNRE